MGSQIKKISVHFPESILTNEYLEKEFGRWEADKITNKIGIKIRHQVQKDETASDIALIAAEKVLENENRNEVDALIYCTQSPDYFLPATACILQEKLKLNNNCAAFDFNQGCSGYIYGLAIAKSFISSGIAKKVLLITAETYTKYINNKDLANKTIFGDAATATIIEVNNIERIHEFILGTDGSGCNNLIVKNGAAKNKYDEKATEYQTDSGDIYTDNNLYMNGPEIFNFTIEAVPKAVNECLAKNSLTLEDVDYFVFHQANKFMIDYLRKKIKIPIEKFYSNMLYTGNTVSSTIPIALSDILHNKILQKDSKVLLCGFGVGYSWGATIINI